MAPKVALWRRGKAQVQKKLLHLAQQSKHVNDDDANDQNNFSSRPVLYFMVRPMGGVHGQASDVTSGSSTKIKVDMNGGNKPTRM